MESGDMVRLLDQVERTLVVQRKSPKTISAYKHWVRHFVRFHGMRNPVEMGDAEVRAYLEHLAV